MIGIDTACISRIRKALDNAAFKARVFTQSEIEYCDGKPDGVQSYAGIFCAKEAVVKALGVGFGNGIMPCDIEIAHDDFGAPYVIAHGNAKSVLRDRDIRVSISHDGDNAVAVAQIVESERR